MLVISGSSVRHFNQKVGVPSGERADSYKLSLPLLLRAHVCQIENPLVLSIIVLDSQYLKLLVLHNLQKQHISSIIHYCIKH